MKTLISPYKVKKFTLAIVHSIAFYPAIIALGFFLLALGAMYAEDRFWLRDAVDEFPFLTVDSSDTARSMLTTLAGGIISLMVFTFTMVMVVLNLASTNYSPRVLPGLISSKPHQIVLGLFLGTITYTITVISNIDSNYYSFTVPKIALIINAAAGAISFIAFIYFIHHISRSIQVSNILVDLHRRSKRLLTSEAENSMYLDELQLPRFSREYVLLQETSGYFHAVSEKTLRKLALKNDLTIRMMVTKGMFVLQGNPLLVTNKPLTDELKRGIFDCFIFQNEELISQNYLEGVKQITEIGLKALSPGINDPGTAIQALDYLADMYLALMPLQGHKVCMEDGKMHLIYAATPICEAIQVSQTEMLVYGKMDPVVVHTMQKHLKDLLPKAPNEEVAECLKVMISQVDAEIEKGEVGPYIKPFPQ